MTLNSATLLWLLALAIGLIVVFMLFRRRRAPVDRGSILEETRKAARQAAERAVQEVAPGVVQDASEAAVRAYQMRQDAIQQEQALKRKEAAARAKDTRLRKIESLQAWRPTFVLFVRRLAEPFFAEWQLDQGLLDQWSEERAEVYIKQKPYVLEVIRSIHADAQRAAERLASQAQKSPREIARDRAKLAANDLERNSHCPYCGSALDEKAHLDHIVPVQRGGPSVPWNMVYVCPPCNHAKHNKSLMEFIDSGYARQKDLKASEISARLRERGKYVDVLH